MSDRVTYSLIEWKFMLKPLLAMSFGAYNPKDVANFISSICLSKKNILKFGDSYDIFYSSFSILSLEYILTHINDVLDFGLFEACHAVQILSEFLLHKLHVHSTGDRDATSSDHIDYAHIIQILGKLSAPDSGYGISSADVAQLISKLKATDIPSIVNLDGTDELSEDMKTKFANISTDSSSDHLFKFLAFMPEIDLDNREHAKSDRNIERFRRRNRLHMIRHCDAYSTVLDFCAGIAAITEYLCVYDCLLECGDSSPHSPHSVTNQRVCFSPRACAVIDMHCDCVHYLLFSVLISDLDLTHSALLLCLEYVSEAGQPPVSDTLSGHEDSAAHKSLVSLVRVACSTGVCALCVCEYTAGDDVSILSTRAHIVCRAFDIIYAVHAHLEQATGVDRQIIRNVHIQILSLLFFGLRKFLLIEDHNSKLFTIDLDTKGVAHISALKCVYINSIVSVLTHSMVHLHDLDDLDAETNLVRLLFCTVVTLYSKARQHLSVFEPHTGGNDEQRCPAADYSDPVSNDVHTTCMDVVPAADYAQFTCRDSNPENQEVESIFGRWFHEALYPSAQSLADNVLQTTADTSEHAQGCSHTTQCLYVSDYYNLSSSSLPDLSRCDFSASDSDPVTYLALCTKIVTTFNNKFLLSDHTSLRDYWMKSMTEDVICGIVELIIDILHVKSLHADQTSTRDALCSNRTRALSHLLNSLLHLCHNIVRVCTAQPVANSTCSHYQHHVTLAQLLYRGRPAVCCAENVRDGDTSALLAPPGVQSLYVSRHRLGVLAHVLLLPCTVPCAQTVSATTAAAAGTRRDVEHVQSIAAHVCDSVMSLFQQALVDENCSVLETDLNVEHAQLFVLAFHNLSLVQKKKMFRKSVMLIIQVSKCLDQRLNTNYVLVFSRLLVLFEYLVRHLYVLPDFLLKQIQNNILQLECPVSNGETTSTHSLLITACAACIGRHSDTSTACTGTVCDGTCVTPSQSSSTDVAGHNCCHYYLALPCLANGHERDQLPTKLDGFALNFLLNSADMFDYSEFYESLLTILATLDCFHIVDNEASAVLFNNLHYCFSIVWSLLISVPPSVKIWREMLMNEFEQISDSRKNIYIMHSLLWGLRIGHKNYAIFIKDVMMRLSMSEQDCDTMLEFVYNQLTSCARIQALFTDRLTHLQAANNLSVTFVMSVHACFTLLQMCLENVMISNGDSEDVRFSDDSVCFSGQLVSMFTNCFVSTEATDILFDIILRLADSITHKIRQGSLAAYRRQLCEHFAQKSSCDAHTFPEVADPVEISRVARLCSMHDHLMQIVSTHSVFNFPFAARCLSALPDTLLSHLPVTGADCSTQFACADYFFQKKTVSREAYFNQIVLTHLQLMNGTSYSNDGPMNTIWMRTSLCLRLILKIIVHNLQLIYVCVDNFMDECDILNTISATNQSANNTTGSLAIAYSTDLILERTRAMLVSLALDRSCYMALHTGVSTHEPPQASDGASLEFEASLAICHVNAEQFHSAALKLIAGHVLQVLFFMCSDVQTKINKSISYECLQFLISLIESPSGFEIFVDTCVKYDEKLGFVGVTNAVDGIDGVALMTACNGLFTHLLFELCFNGIDYLKSVFSFYHSIQMHLYENRSEHYSNTMCSIISSINNVSVLQPHQSRAWINQFTHTLANVPSSSCASAEKACFGARVTLDSSETAISIMNKIIINNFSSDLNRFISPQFVHLFVSTIIDIINDDILASQGIAYVAAFLCGSEVTPATLSHDSSSVPPSAPASSTTPESVAADGCEGLMSVLFTLCNIVCCRFNTSTGARDTCSSAHACDTHCVTDADAVCTFMKVFKSFCRWIVACNDYLCEKNVLSKLNSGVLNGCHTSVLRLSINLLSYLTDVLYALNNYSSDTGYRSVRFADDVNRSVIPVSNALNYDSDSSSDDADDVSDDAEDNSDLPTLDAANIETANSSLCTYTTTRGEYMNQHWYHCHTCALVDSMGACSVCARVCHHGHDVTYAKFGSFFCDCGANKNRSCLCLERRKPHRTHSHNYRLQDTSRTDTRAHMCSPAPGPSVSSPLAGVRRIDARANVPAQSAGNRARAPSESDTTTAAAVCGGTFIASRLLHWPPSGAAHTGACDGAAMCDVTESHISTTENLAIFIACQRNKIASLLEEMGLVSCLLDLLDTLRAVLAQQATADTHPCTLHTSVGVVTCVNAALKSLHRGFHDLHAVEDGAEISVSCAHSSCDGGADSVLVPVNGVSDIVLDGLRFNYTGEQGHTVRELISMFSIKRVLLSTIAIKNKIFLMIAYDKGKIALVSLSTVWRTMSGERGGATIATQTAAVTSASVSTKSASLSTNRRKIMLAKFLTANVQFAVLSITAHPSAENIFVINGLKECRVLIMNTASVVGAAQSAPQTVAGQQQQQSEHTVQTVEAHVESGNYVISTLWLPDRDWSVAVVTAEFVKVFHVDVSVCTPVYHFHMLSGKIVDATFALFDDGSCQLLLMSTTGSIFHVMLDEANRATNGVYYVVNTLEFVSTKIQYRKELYCGGGSSIHYSASLKILLFSFVNGHNFYSRFVKNDTILKPILINPDINTDRLLYVLCRWVECKLYPGLFLAINQINNCAVLLMLRPNGVSLQELRVSHKSNLVEFAFLCSGTPVHTVTSASVATGLSATSSSMPQFTVMLLFDDGYIKLFTASDLDKISAWSRFTLERSSIMHLVTERLHGRQHETPASTAPSHTAEAATTPRQTESSCARLLSRRSGPSGTRTRRYTAASSRVPGARASVSTTPASRLMFPMDFLESCLLMGDVEYGGQDLLHVYNAQQLKHRINTPSLYIASTKTEPFTLEVTNNDSNMIVCAVRLFLGVQDPTCAPSSITIFDRTTSIRCTRSRWFDFPLTRAESMRVVDTHTLALVFAPATPPASVTIIDSVKIYGKTRDRFECCDDNLDSCANSITSTSDKNLSNKRNAIPQTLLEKIVFHILRALQLFRVDFSRHTYLHKKSLAVCSSLLQIHISATGWLADQLDLYLSVCFDSHNALYSFKDECQLAFVYRTLCLLNEEMNNNDLDSELFHYCIVICNSIARNNIKHFFEFSVSQGHPESLINLIFPLFWRLLYCRPINTMFNNSFCYGLTHLSACVHVLCDLCLTYLLSEHGTHLSCTYTHVCDLLLARQSQQHSTGGATASSSSVSPSDVTTITTVTRRQLRAFLSARAGVPGRFPADTGPLVPLERDTAGGQTTASLHVTRAERVAQRHTCHSNTSNVVSFSDSVRAVSDTHLDTDNRAGGSELIDLTADDDEMGSSGQRDVVESAAVVADVDDQEDYEYEEAIVQLAVALSLQNHEERYAALQGLRNQFRGIVDLEDEINSALASLSAQNVSTMDSQSDISGAPSTISSIVHSGTQHSGYANLSALHYSNQALADEDAGVSDQVSATAMFDTRNSGQSSSAASQLFDNLRFGSASSCDDVNLLNVVAGEEEDDLNEENSTAATIGSTIGSTLRISPVGERLETRDSESGGSNIDSVPGDHVSTRSSLYGDANIHCDSVSVARSETSSISCQVQSLYGDDDDQYEMPSASAEHLAAFTGISAPSVPTSSSTHAVSPHALPRTCDSRLAATAADTTASHQLVTSAASGTDPCRDVTHGVQCVRARFIQVLVGRFSSVITDCTHNGTQCIPYLQALLDLIICHECHANCDLTITETAINSLLDHLDLQSELLIRSNTSEIRCLLLRFIGVVLTKFATSSNNVNRDHKERIISRIIDFLLENNNKNILECRSIIEKYMDQCKSVSDHTTTNKSFVPKLFKNKIKHPVFDMSPFFSTSFSKKHADDLFVNHESLFVEILVRLLYSSSRSQPDRVSAILADKGWKRTFVQLISCSHSVSVRRQARKSLIFHCKTKDAYKRLCDLQSFTNYISIIRDLLPISCLAVGYIPSPISYDKLLKVVESIKLCNEICSSRPHNWREFCVSEDNTVLGYLLRLCCYCTEASVNAGIVQLLKMAVSNTDGTYIPDNQTVIDRLIASEDNDTCSSHIFCLFLRMYLLNSNSSNMRWLCHSLILNIFGGCDNHTRQRLIELIWSLWPIVRLHGKNAAQYIDIVGYVFLQIGTENIHVDKYLVELVDSLRTHSECLTNHANHHLYSHLLMYVHVTGHYFESDPCLVCNTTPQDVSTTSHSMLSGVQQFKLTAAKFDSKFTTNAQLTRLHMSHSISQIYLRIRDIEHTRLVRTVNIYCNNKSVSSIVELKYKPDAWYKVQTATLSYGQTDLKIDLSLPIVACNLMIEYANFYENNQATSETLQCPRCTASVSAHPGICGNCGENVYQCHKCRAINYDERDPFLCNACGYSKYGKFEYSLTASQCCTVEPMDSEQDCKAAREQLASLLEKTSTTIAKLKSQRSDVELLLLRAADSSTNTLLSSVFPSETSTSADFSLIPIPSINVNHVSKHIQQLAQKYCNECRLSYDELCQLVQQIHAYKRELMRYDRIHSCTPPPPLSQPSVYQSSTQSSPTPRRRDSLDEAVFNLNPMSGIKCYGCILATIHLHISFLRALSMNSFFRAKLVQFDLIAYLVQNNLHFFSTFSSHEAICQLIVQLTKNNLSATLQLNSLILASARNALATCSFNTKVFTSMICHEMALLNASVSKYDNCWEHRFRCVVQVFSMAVKDPNVLCVCDTIVLPCLLIMINILQSTNNKKLVDNRLELNAGFDTSQWLCGSSSHTFDTWKKQILESNSSIVHCSDRRRQNYLVIKYFTLWRRHVFGNRFISHFLTTNWLHKALFNSSSTQTRRVCAHMLRLLTDINACRKHQILQILVNFLPDISLNGQLSLEFVNLFKSLLTAKWIKYLISIGVLDMLSHLIKYEIDLIVKQDLSSTSVDLSQGYALYEYSHLLSELIEPVHNNPQLYDMDRLLSALLHGHLNLRHLLVRSTRLIERAQSTLLATLERLISDNEERTQLFVRICVSSLQNTYDLSPSCIRPVSFIFERLTQIINPDKSETEVFQILLVKDHQQEDFLQGRMSSSPYSSTDQLMGPRIRDIKNRICRDCDLVALLEDDTGMELLVSNKIMSLDLAVIDVYKRVWLAQPSNESLPMKIVYRVRGLLGDATEEFVENLDVKATGCEDAMDGESAAHTMCDVLGECQGLHEIIRRLSVVKTTPRYAPLLSSLLDLFACSLKSRKNRVLLVTQTNQLPAITSLLSVLCHLLPETACTPLRDTSLPAIQLLLEILHTILVESVRLEERDLYCQFTRSCGSQADFVFLLSSVLRLQGACQSKLLQVVPYLTHECSTKTELLVDHFISCLDFDGFDANPSSICQANLEAFCQLTSNIVRQGNAIKDALLSRGVVSTAVKYLHKNVPDSQTLLAAAISSQLTDTASCELQFLSLPSFNYVLRLLCGLACNHEKTQEALISADIIPTIHRLEQISSEQHVGSLAENLMEVLRSNPEMASCIEEVRLQTRQEKKRLAMSRRQRHLLALGMQTNDKGQVIVKHARYNQLQQSLMSDRTAPASRASVSVEDASADTQDGEQPVDAAGSQSATTSQHARRVADVEDEEETPCCVICREGYARQPDKLLALYTYSRCVALNVETLSAREDLITPASTLSGDLHQVSVGWPPISSVEMFSGFQPGADLINYHTTVSHFNAVHVQCHTDALRHTTSRHAPPTAASSSASLSSSRRDEWQKSALHNANTRCNGLLPIWSGCVAEAEYTTALARFIQCARADSQTSSRCSPFAPTPLSSSPPSYVSANSLYLILHDLRLLLWRLSSGQSLSVDSGGGSVCSNLQMLPHLLHAAVYLVNKLQVKERLKSQMLEYVSACVGDSGSDFSSCNLIVFWAVVSVITCDTSEWYGRAASIDTEQSDEQGDTSLCGQILHSLLKLCAAEPQQMSRRAEEDMSDISTLFLICKPFLIYFALLNDIYRKIFSELGESSDSEQVLGERCDNHSAALSDYVRSHTHRLATVCDSYAEYFSDTLMHVCELHEFLALCQLTDCVPDAEQLILRVFQSPVRV